VLAPLPPKGTSPEGLEKLQEMLTKYQGILEMMEPDDETAN
jgi:hypothetical protein